jgi:Recombination endonuclease VII.
MPHTDKEVRRAYAREWQRKNHHRFGPKRAAFLRQFRKDHPERASKYNFRAHLKRKLRQHGVSRDAYDLMLKEQGGLCAICLLPPTGTARLCIDHDHNTNEFRGLLRRACNRAIGLLRDNAANCEAASEYLHRHWSICAA